MYRLRKCHVPCTLIALFCSGFFLLGSCDNKVPDPGVEHADQAVTADNSRPAATAGPARAGGAERSIPADNADNPQFNPSENQLIVDVTAHSREELMALLERADEVATLAAPDFDGLDIALILRGPDIGWFARENYEENKPLVDLAARLDALNVINMKICQRAMSEYGYTEQDSPQFIDRVPFGPDEMDRLQGTGYYML